MVLGGKPAFPSLTQMSKMSNFEEAGSLRDVRDFASQLPAEVSRSAEGGEVLEEGAGAAKGEGWRLRETQRLGGGALAATIAVLLGGQAKAQQATPTPAPQQTKPQQQQTAQLPEVLVTGQDDYRAPALSLQRIGEPLLTTPQSVNVVTQQLLQDQGVTSLKDSLRNVSGVSIGAGEGKLSGR